jgi:selenocysteine lyase/cysteine desulfurase
LLYGGIQLRPEQELLYSRQDYYATREALALAAAKSGAQARTIDLYSQIESVSEPEIVERLLQSVTPRTRVVGVTWVHSSTGLKLPIARIAAALAEVNAEREPADRALLCVDGVHGLGVEDVTMSQLGCDFFVAGTHKWLFGPRGTGLVWGRPEAWPAANPIIPTFGDPDQPGSLMTPGGFHSFEHRWALSEAFKLHLQLGKATVAARIHALNAQLKEGLAAMPHVTLYTPRAEQLSAGLVCFDVAGLRPQAVIQRLRERAIIGSTTPYAASYARLTPGLLNSPEEVDLALSAIHALA